jgi:hypothetical protein
VKQISTHVAEYDEWSGKAQERNFNNNNIYDMNGEWVDQIPVIEEGHEKTHVQYNGDETGWDGAVSADGQQSRQLEFPEIPREFVGAVFQAGLRNVIAIGRHLLFGKSCWK